MLRVLKKIALVVVKLLALLLGIIGIALPFMALGDRLATTTQIGTIASEMFMPLIIVALIIALAIAAVALGLQKRAGRTWSKLTVVTCAVVAAGLVCSSLLWHANCQAVRDGGGSVTLADGFDMFKDPSDDGKVVYATKDGQDLTISLYKNGRQDGDGLAPVYVYFHGGGWTSNTSETDGVTHRAMADAGYVGFSINYRLCTDDSPTWDKAIEDCADAMRWIVAHAEEYGGDPDRIVIAGESAGGHLALLYTGMVTSGALDAPAPAAVCALYPVVDLAWTSEHGSFIVPTPGIVERYIGGSLDEYPERVAAVSPLNYLTANMPPTLIVHGAKDTLVTVDGSREYAQELTDLGVKNQLVVIPYCNHGTIGNVSFMLNFLGGVDDMSVA